MEAVLLSAEAHSLPFSLLFFTCKSSLPQVIGLVSATTPTMDCYWGSSWISCCCSGSVGLFLPPFFFSFGLQLMISITP